MMTPAKEVAGKKPQSYKDLEIYRLAYEGAVRIHNLLHDTGALTDEAYHRAELAFYETLGRKIHSFRESVIANNPYAPGPET